MSILRTYYEHVVRLSDDQLNRLGTVTWLLSNSDQSIRASGRSLLMALSFVRDASLMPGKWVKVWDHHDPDRVGRRLMIERIGSLFPGRDVEISDHAIMVHEGWPHNKIDKMSGERRQIREIMVDDIKSLTIATLRTGVSIESIMEAVKEALVQYVMEA